MRSIFFAKKSSISNQESVCTPQAPQFLTENSFPFQDRLPFPATADAGRLRGPPISPLSLTPHGSTPPSPRRLFPPIPSPRSFLSSPSGASIAASLGAGTMEEPRRRAPRALTGRHVRSGTGASPRTLEILRKKILERMRLKELLGENSDLYFGALNKRKGGGKKHEPKHSAASAAALAAMRPQQQLLAAARQHQSSLSSLLNPATFAAAMLSGKSH